MGEEGEIWIVEYYPDTDTWVRYGPSSTEEASNALLASLMETAVESGKMDAVRVGKFIVGPGEDPVEKAKSQGMGG
jgi:hypothetical protein